MNASPLGEVAKRVQSWRMTPLTLIAAAAAAAVQAAAPETIVVTGVPLSQLQREAVRCETGGCTPREDIVATVRYAEGLFRVGRYIDSRVKLQKAITRNRVAGRSDPAALSALYEATATVSRHEGDQRVWEAATYARSRLIRDTAPPDSAQRLLSDLDLLAFEGKRHPNPALVDTKYERLAHRARDAEQPDVAARVSLQHAMFARRINQPARARRMLAEIIARPGGAAPVYGQVARALSAQLAHERGDKQAANAFLADINRAGTETPLLVWAPPIQPPTSPVNADPMGGAVVDGVTVSSDVFVLRWADIGFTVRADGTVEDADILRGVRENGWAQLLVKAIAARRYAPLKFGSSQYRVERWTLTGDYHAPIGSFIRRRAVNPRYEQLPMVGDEPVAVAAKAPVTPLPRPSPAE